MKIITSLLVAFGLLLVQAVSAAPAIKYWGIWDKSDETSVKTIDHSIWGAVLSGYLNSRPDGVLFAYSKVTTQDREKLQKYLAYLAGLDPRLFNRKEQKAYWINLYNALTVELILDNYPVKSITRIGPWYKFGPWDDEITSVAGEPLTLNDIEHRILRPIWQDKRIHYVVNCASKGCPDLAAQPYTGATVDDMMEEAAERYIRQEKGAVFIDGKLTLSRIYEWYATDFGSRESLLRHIKRYSRPDMMKRIDKYTGELVYQYSWSLNEP